MPQAFPGFITIGAGIYVNLTPTDNLGVHTDEFAPNVILIFGWYGAPKRHLRHYSQKYSELYPDATQIIIMIPGQSFFWATARVKTNRMKPVAEALESLGCFSSTSKPAQWRPRVLAHLFSITGAVQLMFLARLLSSKYPSVPLVSALVLDSAPASVDFRAMHKASNFAIRNPFARFIALTGTYVIHSANLSLEKAFGLDTLPTQIIKMLHKPSPLPWMDSETPRLYIFSKKDQLLSWKGIQKHANTAKALGLNVRSELYDESAHVAHVHLDPERYWASIQDLWYTACYGSEVKFVEAI